MNEGQKQRVPGKVKPYVRDANGFRTNVFKNLHRKSGSGLSLKQFARAVMMDLSRSEEQRASAAQLFHNKGCNPANLPRGIGSTRKKKGGPGGGGKK